MINDFYDELSDARAKLALLHEMTTLCEHGKYEPEETYFKGASVITFEVAQLLREILNERDRQRKMSISQVF